MIKKILTSMLLIILFCIFIYSFYNILMWLKDNRETDKLIVNVQENVYKEDEDDNRKIDFTKLFEINAETVGWIEIENTNINYPIVRHKDNIYYLSHSFNNSYNDAGWVFLDYRNKFTPLDDNNILYAHGRIDGSMFGSLKNLFNDEYYNSNDHTFKLYTPTKNYKFEVFSFYKIRTTNDYLKISFDTVEEHKEFIEKIIKRSVYDFNIEVNPSDKILTLSTCYNNYEKLVMHAKLIR